MRAIKAPRPPRKEKAGGAATRPTFGMSPRTASLSEERSETRMAESTVWPAERHAAMTNTMSNAMPPRTQSFLA